MSPNAVRGVDVSHHNSLVNWAALKKAGIEYAYVKASEGTSFVDPMFFRNMIAARAAGILVGAYHYFHWGDSVQGQVSAFLGTATHAQFDLPPVLDWEQRGGPTTQSQPALAWLQAVQSQMGRRPVIYADTGMLAFLKLDPLFAQYPLWVARYGPEPTIQQIGPWTSWTIWQDSENGTLPGLAEHFDTDWFNGSVDDLRTFAKS